MRVVMVGDFPRRANEIEGGVEAVTSYLAGALRSFPDIEIMGVTLDRWGGGSRVEDHNGLAIYFVPVSKRPSRISNWQNVREMSRVISSLKPDLVHAHIANQYASAARATAKPWVLTAHGIRHLEMALRPGLLNRYREWTVKREEFELMEAATHLISISPFITETFSGRLTADVTHIDNPVSEAFFGAPRQPRDGTVLYVGRLIPRKDIFTLLRSIKRVREQVPGCRLRLAGDGISGLEPGSYRDQLAGFVRENKLEGCVDFLGQLDDDELRSEYSTCELMVVSSVLETAPMVILQAMAAGVPVVSTDVGGIRYLVEEGRSGYLVPPEDPEAMANKVVEILEDSDARDAMGARALAIANDRLRASEVAARTREVYFRAAVHDNEQRMTS